MRFLAIDPGDKRIGLAISDPTGTIANPLSVLKHISRAKNATRIIEICKNYKVEKIIVGQSLDEDGIPTIQGRKAARLAAAIQVISDIPVVLWDEYASTKIAKNAQIIIKSGKKKRKGHIDEIAATVILQSYLDAISPQNHDCV
ncbi:MAG TPA: Holliday junction resolvase RuvX [Anaerolineae bacterium]|nr:Holliday junction resolvase RuvX [Anaerolineae bacterium]